MIVIENGCSDTSACFPVTTVNIKTAQKENLVSVFPTNAKEQVNIKFESIQQSILVKVIDVLGKTIIQTEYTNSKQVLLNLIELKAGNYFIQVETQDNTSIHRIIKNG